ncbi:MAG: thiamine pyrophosphate-dependent enzyme [Nanoarchaeota archaeon]|nr:thiamine pyrophosphate-dependent enzyme [Nanoarchaeota archaeon]
MNLENLTGVKDLLIGFEREMAALYLDGKINGPAHFSSGNEIPLIKIFRGLREGDYEYSSRIDLSPEGIKALQESGQIEVHDSINSSRPIFKGVKSNDWVFGSYRNHLQALLHDVPRDWLKTNILQGRSMEVVHPDYKIFTTGIVGGQLPIAVGYAMALKRKGSLDHVWAFCGDMAAETGIFEETTKYAQNFNLPVTFVVEYNGMSVDTPTERVWNGISPLRRSNTVRYFYANKVPHQGVGKEVGF